MGIENWKNPIEQNKDTQPEKPESEERRAFMKKGLKIGAGAAGLALGLGCSKPEEDEKSGQEKKEEEPEKTKETVEPPEKQARELVGVEKIAAEILRVHNTPQIGRRFDPKVFIKDFVMAQQFQESRYKDDSESASGAEGVYQNKPCSTIDVVKYLNFLREKTADLPANQRVDYNGPESISEAEAEEIGDLFKERTDYGRAVGKLYLLSIHDPETDYNTKNPDVFRGKSPVEQQRLLLISYHDGPGKRFHPEKASPNGKKYVEHVFNHMEVIADLRQSLEKHGMSRDLDYAIIKIMRELERAENRGKPEEAKNKWLKKLQEAHMKKWKQTGDYDASISNKEIWEIFPE